MKKIDLRTISSDVITNANNRELFNKYLAEIYKYKPLTREEEVELFKLITEKNDKSALDKVCKHNLRFVVSVAKKYSIYLNKSTLTLEDLVNEGNVGLCIAATRFDYKSGNKFISYAVWWIRQSILSLVQKNVKTIRLPLNVKQDINKILDKREQLEQRELGHVTTLQAFESLLEEGEINPNYDTATISNMLNLNNFETSLNVIVGDEGGCELADMVRSNDNTPDYELIENERNEFALNMLNSLPTYIQEYFIDYFGFFGRKQLKLVEMAKKYDELPETIRTRIKKYLRMLKLKHKFEEPHF